MECRSTCEQGAGHTSKPFAWTRSPTLAKAMWCYCCTPTIATNARTLGRRKHAACSTAAHCTAGISAGGATGCRTPTLGQALRRHSCCLPPSISHTFSVPSPLTDAMYAPSGSYAMERVYACIFGSRVSDQQNACTLGEFTLGPLLPRDCRQWSAVGLQQATQMSSSIAAA